jgi:DNA-directed RNA polymerase specialized sigma24 family protein
MNDKEALKLMRKNNSKGLVFFHRKYNSRVKKAILSIKNEDINENDADEICNQTFFQFNHTIKYFKEECSVLTWLNTLAYQETLKQLRIKKIPIENISIDTPIDKFLEENDKLDKHDCYQYCIRTYISSNTKKRYQNCLENLTFFYQGYSIEEIAQKMNRSFSATTSFLSSCRKTFKQNSLLKQCWEDCNN